MASHFLFHSEAHETVPLNAQYGFPSQATRTLKSTVKLTPRDGGPYSPGSIIRIDFPAQGYLNPINTTLRFGVSAWYTSGSALTPTDAVRLHNNANTCFSRLRVLYGSLVLEDIQDYNVLVRLLTNCTVADDYFKHAGAVYEGMGSEFQRARVQSRALTGATTVSSGSGITAGTADSTAWSVATAFSEDKCQFFQIHLLSGILTQPKLIPLKWMASQLRIELYCAPAQQVLIMGNPSTASWITKHGADPLKTRIADVGDTDAVVSVEAAGAAIVAANDDVEFGTATDNVISALSDSIAVTREPEVGSSTKKLTYGIGKVELIAEILEFDENYDAAAVAGMATHGIPIHYQSWHSFPFAISANSTNAQYAIQERAKSIKAAFACILNNTLMSQSDEVSFLFDSFAMTRLNITEYIWRVGGKYFPSQSVVTRGAAIESFVELQKALNLLGNYEAGCQIHPELYGSFGSGSGVDDYYHGPTPSTTNWALAKPYTYLGGIDHPYGKHIPWKQFGNTADDFKGGAASMFCIGTSFEATPGREISGINGEEQNELLLRLTRSAVGNSLTENNTLYVFTYYDAMMVIRPNNVVDLIQ
jgi:hypothetical protein